MNHREKQNQKKKSKIIKTVSLGTVATVVASGFYVLANYKTCKPNQFIIKTGLGIKNTYCAKKTLRLPLQEISYVDLNPYTYEFNLHSMSKEKIEFNLPVVFTVGVTDPDKNMELFEKYSKTMVGVDKKERERLIKGIIEGECRGLTATLTVEEMFNSKDRFRDDVVNNIQKDLNEIGLHVYNANIKEMSDYDENNKYFEYRKKRAIEKANYEAQIDVSTSQREGEIGIETNRRTTRITIAKLEQEAKIQENEREQEIAKSNAQLAEVRAEANRVSEVAKIEAEMAAENRKIELQKEIELRKKEQLVEKLRSEELTKAIVDSEAKERKADADYYAKTKESDSYMYDAQIKSQAMALKYNAESEGMNKILESCKNDHLLAQFYISLNNDLYKQLAHMNAKAIKNMKPKMHIWNTGSNSDENNNGMKPIINMVQSMAPLIKGLESQGNMKIPDWFMKTNNEKSVQKQ